MFCNFLKMPGGRIELPTPASSEAELDYIIILS